MPFRQRYSYASKERQRGRGVLPVQQTFKGTDSVQSAAMREALPSSHWVSVGVTGGCSDVSPCDAGKQEFIKRHGHGVAAKTRL